MTTPAFDHLTFDSTLADLPAYSLDLPPSKKGQDVLTLLEQDPLLPGVLVMDSGHLLGVISRETFFERTGKLFGTEIFLGRPLSVMLKTLEFPPLVLEASCLIAQATQVALSRKLEAIYQPIVIRKPGPSFGLVSALILFMAQSHQMMSLHRQRLYTVERGLPITDEEAVSRFIAYAELDGGFRVEDSWKRHSIRCDRCNETVCYTLADVVRCFPELARGIVVEERMGSRSIWLYVRHRCRGEIWEIPVQHDARLEYRSQRPVRLVEVHV